MMKKISFEICLYSTRDEIHIFLTLICPLVARKQARISSLPSVRVYLQMNEKIVSVLTFDEQREMFDLISALVVVKLRKAR